MVPKPSIQTLNEIIKNHLEDFISFTKQILAY